MSDNIIDFISIQDSSNYVYGIRIDEIQYKVGDIANVSHQLYQDPQFDEFGELLFEKGTDIYSEYYDAGELDGTSCISFVPENKESIILALNMVKAYYGEYIHILRGETYKAGNDFGEIIIKDAEVIASYRKEVVS